MEMLLVVTILALISAAVVPRLIDVRNDTYVGVLKNDLTNLAGAMEHHMTTYGEYPNTTLNSPADSLLPGALGTGRLAGFAPDDDVTIKYLYKSADGYRARAMHLKLPGKWCDIYSGNIPSQGYFNPTPTPDIRCPLP